MACPSLEDSIIFGTVEILLKNTENFLEICEDLFLFFGDRLKNCFEHLFLFGEHFRVVSLVLVLGLEHSCLGLERVCPRKGCRWPWPRIFCVLGLEPCVLDYTSACLASILKIRMLISWLKLLPNALVPGSLYPIISKIQYSKYSISSGDVTCCLSISFSFFRRIGPMKPHSL